MHGFPNELACLHDPVKGLTYYEVPAEYTDGSLPEKIRGMFIDRMERYGYVGFSYIIDNKFHNRSTYVLVGDDEGDIVMTSRITYRPPGSVIPFEDAERRNGGSYSLEESTKVVDINTYTYAKNRYKDAMPLLSAGLGRHANAQSAQCAFCLYDEQNNNIRDAYESIGFVLSSRFPEPIQFPTIRYRNPRSRDKCDPEPVFWRIMEWDAATILSHANRAENEYQVIA